MNEYIYLFFYKKFINNTSLKIMMKLILPYYIIKIVPDNYDLNFF